jgi:oxalate decarboxylase/phosphoglucose isomerase-like protein (cupin superfamily)
MDINNILIEKINNNIKVLEINNYSEINLDIHPNILVKYKIIDKINNSINSILLQNELLSYNLDWSMDGKSDIILGNILYKDFLNNIDENKEKYIFHNILENKDIYNIIQKYIPLPMINKTNKMRISRFYSGYKYSGTNIHNHTRAINYLISGMKLWIMFPNSNNNKNFLLNHKLYYDTNNNLPLNCFLENYNNFKKNIENLSIILQEEGDSVYIPEYYYHGIINISDCCGITYSWF